MTVNDKVRELLLAKFTQKEILEELKKRGHKMSQSNLSKKLHNNVGISFEELRLFADIAEEDISSFFD